MPIFPLQSKKLEEIRQLSVSNCPCSSLQAFSNVNDNNQICSLQNLQIFLSNHTKLGVMLFLCAMQKKASLLQIAQMEMYLNLQSLLSILH